MVTIAADSEGTKDERIEKAFFIVEPNQKELAEISRLLDSGELQCCVDAVVPFFRASDAYCGTIKEPRGRGRIVLSMIDAIQPARHMITIMEVTALCGCHTIV